MPWTSALAPREWLVQKCSLEGALTLKSSGLSCTLFLLLPVFFFFKLSSSLSQLHHFSSWQPAFIHATSTSNSLIFPTNYFFFHILGIMIPQSCLLGPKTYAAHQCGADDHIVIYTDFFVCLYSEVEFYIIGTLWNHQVMSYYAVWHN